MSEDDDKPPVDPNLPPREEVEPELPLKALTLLQKAVHGNGVKKEDTMLTNFEGEVLHFLGFEIFRIEPRIAEKMMPGRENGEVAGSRQDTRYRIQAAIEKITLDKDVQQNTIDFLKKRPDLGFGIDGTVMGLDRLARTYVVHETCSSCSGLAQAACQGCAGQGKIQCPRCHRARTVSCPHCHGMKTVVGQNGRQQTCTRCRGRGDMPCTTCRHTGFILCKRCNGASRIACQHCAGTGFLSVITRMDIKAKSRFDFDREALPDGVAPLIDRMRDKLVTENHAAVYLSEDKILSEEINKIRSKPDEFIIVYHVRLPWGKIDFMLADKGVSGHMFGFQPLLVDMPPFLEDTALRGLRELAEAALAVKGDTAAKLREAARIRLAGETILAAARHSAGKAAALLYKRYPFGISIDALRAAVQHANMALGHITKKARLGGLLAGVMGASLLCAVYYIGPLRRMIAAQAGQGSPLTCAADFALLATGSAVTAAAMQYFAANAVRKALGKLLPKNKKDGQKDGLRPVAGRILLWAVAGGIAAYALILELAIAGGAAIPSWYAILRALLSS